ncbi:MAG: hypothetical protein BWY11_01779 [Firmicutes bacterium ADurb.Bin182]|nr:MAG: hypothetical protein BWY11_01779 [Firmicutes bacterium ADurb.Bin182]
MHEGHRARLRKSYIESGADVLEDHRLLELLLTFSIPRKDTNELAHLLIDRYGSLKAVLSADIRDIQAVEGIGENSAVLLNLAGDIIRRIGMGRSESIKLKTASDAARHCIALLSRQKYEAMYVLSLDKNKKLLHADKISSGTLGETVIYPRLVIECALRHHAYSVILAHNHPSGGVTPSKDDIQTTSRISEALGAIGIRLEDHIITGGDRAYSIAGETELSGQDLFMP